MKKPGRAPKRVTARSGERAERAYVPVGRSRAAVREPVEDVVVRRRIKRRPVLIEDFAMPMPVRRAPGRAPARLPTKGPRATRSKSRDY